MGYEIRALLARVGTFEQEASTKHPMIIAPLEQGLEMLLNTDEFFDSFSSNEKYENRRWPQFVYLSADISAFCTELSQRSLVAYIEADYFGGVGCQASIVWSNGEIVVGPLGNMEAKPGLGTGPINSALKFLGVSKTDSDEFDAVGLSKYRHLEDWEAEHS